MRTTRSRIKLKIWKVATYRRCTAGEMLLKFLIGVFHLWQPVHGQGQEIVENPNNELYEKKKPSIEKMDSILERLAKTSLSTKATMTTPTARPLSDRLHGVATGGVEEGVGSSVPSSAMLKDVSKRKMGI